jgi:quercetin dioxygenase-like cupin family protein
MKMIVSRCLAAALACGAVAGVSSASAQMVRCLPVEQRTGEIGCWSIANTVIGQLPPGPVAWHLDRYGSRGEAETAKRPGATVVEALGKIWLLTVAEAGWRPTSGERVAEIGPLPVTAEASYATQYLEAIFRPGMRSIEHRHGGPEVWYTESGETCLETPDGKLVGRPGQPVIVPGGPPMELTATGTELRRAVVLILYDVTKPATTIEHEWKPKGLCRQ